MKVTPRAAPRVGAKACGSLLRVSVSTDGPAASEVDGTTLGTPKRVRTAETSAVLSRRCPTTATIVRRVASGTGIVKPTHVSARNFVARAARL